MADVVSAAGLRIPPLTRQTQRVLHEGLIPEYLRVSNPVDSGGPPVADERGAKIIDAILADPNVDILVVPITGAVVTFSEQFTLDLVAAARTTDKPIFVIWGAPSGTDNTYYQRLLDGGLPTFRTFSNCVQAMRAYVDYWTFIRRYRSPFDDAPREPSKAAAKARRILARTAPGHALSEHASKELLRAYGIKPSRDVLCTSAAQAVAAAKKLGLPVVMKVSSADLTHKSDLGGVEVGVGVSHDPLFGPVVMVGLGGVFVEVLRDVTFRVPPFDAGEAERMLRELQGFPLLEGVRGAKPADLDALVDVIMKTQRLALDLSDDVAELDVNPLVVKPRGAVALDALIVRAG